MQSKKGYRPVNTGTYPLESSGARLSFAGVKLHSDRSIQGGTGYLKAPYHLDTSGNRGFLLKELTVLKEQILDLHLSGVQIAVHANGDAAVEHRPEYIRVAPRQHVLRVPSAARSASQGSQDQSHA